MKNKKKLIKIEQILLALVAVIFIIILILTVCYKKREDKSDLIYYSYATNDWYNVLLKINKKIPRGIATYSTKEEALSAFPKNDLDIKPFLIMHKMNQDTIIESYILINKDGKYYAIRGGYKVSGYSDEEIKNIQELNKKTLKEAFGEDSCSILDDETYYCHSEYDLAEGEWTLKVEKDGRVRAAGYDSFCVIDKNGGSGCGVTPQDDSHFDD